MTGSPVSITAAASEPPSLDGKLTYSSVQTSVCGPPAISQEPAGPPQLQQSSQSLPLHTQSSAAAASAASGRNESTHMPAAQQSPAANSNTWTDRLPQTLPLPWPLWKRSKSPIDPVSTTQTECSSASIPASASSPQHGPGSFGGVVRDACRLSQILESSASSAAAASDLQVLVADPHPASQDEEDNEPCSETPAEATTHVRASSANSIGKGAVADSATRPDSTSEVSPTNGSRTGDVAPDVASSSLGRVGAAADAMAHITADPRTSDTADCTSFVPDVGGKPGRSDAAKAQALTLEQRALVIKGVQLSKQVQQVCCASSELRPTLFPAVSTMTVNKKIAFSPDHQVSLWIFAPMHMLHSTATV